MAPCTLRAGLLVLVLSGCRCSEVSTPGPSAAPVVLVPGGDGATIRTARMPAHLPVADKYQQIGGMPLRLPVNGNRRILPRPGLLAPMMPPANSPPSPPPEP